MKEEGSLFHGDVFVVCLRRVRDGAGFLSVSRAFPNALALSLDWWPSGFSSPKSSRHHSTREGGQPFLWLSLYTEKTSF